jgi:hypothetical protein
MTKYSDTGTNPSAIDEEPEGPARYLQPGEELLILTPDIQIKKFRFDSYLTDRRLFLIDQNEKRPGVTAKEIPRPSIVDAFVEHSSTQEPVLVISIRTSDDDIRTMKMIFVHTGKDRVEEAEEWVHLIHRGQDTGTSQGTSGSGPAIVTAATSPEVRSLSETMVFPTPRKPEPVPISEPVKPPEPDNTRIVAKERSAEPHPVSQPPSLSQTQMLFCHHCGHRIPPNANFCPYCGTRMHGNTQGQERPGQLPPQPPARAPAPAKTPDEPKPAEKKEKKKGWASRLFGRK